MGTGTQPKLVGGGNGIKERALLWPTSISSGALPYLVLTGARL